MKVMWGGMACGKVEGWAGGGFQTADVWASLLVLRLKKASCSGFRGCTQMRVFL